MLKMAGRAAVVTGAANGIGRAIAWRLAAEGCIVSLWDIDESSLETSAGILRESGAQTNTRIVDVSDLDAVDAAFRVTGQTIGIAPDILVNNAGIARVASIIDGSPEDFDLVMRVNVRGTFNCSRAMAASMVERGGGSIVNIASWLGKSARPMSLAYCASKFAVIGMTQSMAIDLAPHGIRVNAVCPGVVTNTGMRDKVDAMAATKGMPSALQREQLIPLRRLGQPEDVAGVVAFLLSQEASYMTGQAINVTGGLWMS